MINFHYGAMGTFLVLAAFVVPLGIGFGIHYGAFVSTAGKRPRLTEIAGTVAGLVAAMLLFPSAWHDMEYLTCALFIGYLLIHLLFFVLFQPVARVIGRRHLTNKNASSTNGSSSSGDPRSGSDAA